VTDNGPTINIENVLHIMNHEIIRYDSIYNDQICELEKEIWSPDLNVNKSYLRWKYFDNPYTTLPKIYIVLLEGKVVAVRGMYETKWQFGNSADGFTALCAGDTVIHPEYRNKGIYPELANFIKNDLCELGYRYLFNFSAGPTTLINNLAIGWKSIGRIRTMSIESSPRTIIRKLMSEHMINKLIKNTTAAKFLKRLINKFGYNSYNKLLRYHKKMHTHLRIEKYPITDEMAILVGKLAGDNKLVLTRDEKFFKWRYSNPLSKYIFIYWYDKELKGYLTAQTPLYKLGFMDKFNIIELEGVNSIIKMDLLKSMISLLDSRSISVWSNMLNEDCRKFLALNGFIESSLTGSASEYTPTILVTMTNGPANVIEYRGMNLLDMNNWDLKMMYSDAY
jgi:hypothetical protein